MTYAVQAHEFVAKTPFVPYHGRTTGFIVNYTPDSAVRFDFDGNPVEHFDRAYIPGQVEVFMVSTSFRRVVCLEFETGCRSLPSSYVLLSANQLGDRGVPLELRLFKSKSGVAVAVNPAFVRFLRDAGTGSVTIVFTEDHEIVVEGTIADVMDNLQGRK